ncbi:putative alpha/beta hydrolase family esterase [Pararhizobium capsulatum DSM 1112]|uniref:Alpha/beta hydrolase family esterase n=1 Tax=Pararhizobium capsulatum DSM 1112 TaxID=1121113 RepID=A0ABU0BTU6_9HYPH|nr:alpha/beta hydrolase [Pararhizobium capsulatum]MDQ0321679.1 putative alpha/beta hydrolase family esterase [Pararhizobium capsulatum DSM 1112]
MAEEGCRVSIDTLVLPGLNGSGEGHWQWHWLRDHANARGVEQDNWICPDLDDWRARLQASLTEVRSVWLVAHSLGCILAANLADSPLASRIKGALLVAPCDLSVVEELHPCAVNFGAMPLKRLPFPSLVVGSLNDPYMDFNMTQRVAQAWGSELIDLGHAGHINIRSRFGRWPQGYDLLRLLQTNIKKTTIAAATERRSLRPSTQAAYS